MTSQSSEPPRGGSVAGPKLPSFLDVVALGTWMGGIHAAAILIGVALFNLPATWAITLLVLLVTLSVIPIFDYNPFAVALSKFISKRAVEYFPVSVIYEDEATVKATSPSVIAIEPHAILPLGSIGLSENAPKAAHNKVRLGATTAIFSLPILRHIWSWMGLAPASKKHLKALLGRGVTAMIVPGGVQECLYFEKGVETIFLKKRKGFVRLALEERVPLVPVYIFGQSEIYNWWKPTGKWYNALSRSLGFAPLLFWGVWGSFIPVANHMTVVVGKPLNVPPLDEAGASEVDTLHRTFIEEMERLFDTYKEQAGYKASTLRIL